MKKDKRGRQPTDADQAPSTPEDAPSTGEDASAQSDVAGDLGADATESPKSSSDESSEAPRKRTLPAFGFAADLLRQTEPDKAAPADSPSAAAEGEDSEQAEDNLVEADGSTNLDFSSAAFEQPDAADEDSSLDASAPTRIFDFADQIADRSRRQQEEVAPVQLDTFVTFALAGETFAMPVRPVRQVFRVSTITRVPHAPRPIRGVTNLRGRVIPLIDLRLRVGLPETELQRSSRVISVSSRGRIVGLLVDAVHQVVHLDVLRVQPPPDDVMTIQSDYIQGVYGEGDDLILLLDIDRALIIREAGAA